MVQRLARGPFKVFQDNVDRALTLVLQSVSPDVVGCTRCSTTLNNAVHNAVLHSPKRRGAGLQLIQHAISLGAVESTIERRAKRDFQKENSNPTVGPFSVKLSPIRLVLVSLLTTRRLPNW